MTKGRAPKAAKVPVSFRFGEAAKANLEALAAAEGITPRSFLEKRVLELDQPHIVARVKEHPDLRALLFQVNKTGNNINQIAKAINTDIAADRPIDAARLLHLLIGVDQTLKELRDDR